MVDISEYGEIKIHKKYTDGGHDVIQFIPKGDSFVERNFNLKSMIKDISKALTEREIQRGILIQASKKFPTPCFIVFDYDL
jgi:hypothetical protein|tara:strand:+ start:713 stop:955 length:243 start_codon:yes stop_codon:yes gene_type:complete